MSAARLMPLSLAMPSGAGTASSCARQKTPLLASTSASWARRSCKRSGGGRVGRGGCPRRKGSRGVRVVHPPARPPCPAPSLTSSSAASCARRRARLSSSSAASRAAWRSRTMRSFSMRSFSVSVRCLLLASRRFAAFWRSLASIALNPPRSGPPAQGCLQAHEVIAEERTQATRQWVLGKKSPGSAVPGPRVQSLPALLLRYCYFKSKVIALGMRRVGLP